jgi:hypothetical protein
MSGQRANVPMPVSSSAAGLPPETAEGQGRSLERHACPALGALRHGLYCALLYLGPGFNMQDTS